MTGGTPPPVEEGRSPIDVHVSASRVRLASTAGSGETFREPLPENSALNTADDLWAAAPASSTQTNAMMLQHFDGKAWARAEVPLPERGGGDRVVRSTNGGIVLIGSKSERNNEGTGTTVWYATRWNGSGWASPEQIADRVVAGCGDYVCGVNVTGELEDGTLVFTHTPTTKTPRW